MNQQLWDDDRIGSELDKIAFWCGPGDPEMVAVYDAKVIMRRMRDEYEAMLAATWQPVEQAEIACDCGECGRVIIVEEECLQIDGPDGMLTAHLPEGWALCRRVEAQENRRAQPAWEPVADGELVQDVLSAAGEGIACHRFALPDAGQLTQLAMRWVDEDGEWQDYFVALPSAYWLCRRVAGPT